MKHYGGVQKIRVSTNPQPQIKKRSFPYVLCALCIYCIWLIWNSLTPTLPKISEPPRFYSNPSREDLRLTILHSIHKARSSVFLCMFGLSDPSILNALQSKLHKNIPVTIHYDAKGSPDVRKTLQGAEIHPIQNSGIMHQKILVLDDEMVFLGSTNFTTQSLKMHDNLIIGLSSARIAKFLTEKTPHSTGYLRCLVGGQDIELWLLPDPKGHVLTDLKRKIRTACRSLKIALFTLTHPVLVDEIIQAKKRGVSITVIIDMHSALGASASAVETLLKANVRVLCSQGVQLMHHKLVYIDDQTLVTGSANWTKAAFAKNSDCLLVLHHLNNSQKSHMNRLWQTIETASTPAENMKKGAFLPKR